MWIVYQVVDINADKLGDLSYPHFLRASEKLALRVFHRDFSMFTAV
jgi:hypothetical protein